MSDKASLILCLGLSLWLLGCTAEKSSSEKEGSPESSERESKEQSVTYEEGKGLLLKKETAEAIGLQFVNVSEQPLTSRVDLEAQVYLASGDGVPTQGQKRSAYASSMIPADLVKQLKIGDRITLIKGGNELTGSLSKLSPPLGGSTDQTSLTLEIVDPKRLLHVGEFIHVDVTSSLTKKNTLSIPKGALLESISGTFVFVDREGHLLRIPVATGRVTSGLVQITEGLNSGERVVVAPVELIYLTELRLTKGGGHAD